MALSINQLINKRKRINKRSDLLAKRNNYYNSNKKFNLKIKQFKTN